MPEQARNLSPQLRAAQERLLALRVEREVKMKERETAVSANRHSSHSFSTPFHLPDHLGWHSQPFSMIQKTAVHSQCHPTGVQQVKPAALPLSKPGPKCNAIQLYPDMALSLLRSEQVAAGRIWLLLRHLDLSGRGWIAVAEARAALTTKHSATRVCGWRQLRNLLAQGEGIFWVRKNGRLWLRSLPKVSAQLGITKLSSQPVALSVSILTQRIGTVRAHFYASFHSSRTHHKPGATSMKPIARSTIQKITHVHPRIQRLYEKTARVRRQRNFSVGAAYSPEAVQDGAWQRGSAVFSLTDKHGRFGPPGKRYLAWQLPNSYTGPHQPQTNNQLKRINRALTDLMLQGTTGNGQCMSIPEPEPFVESGVRYCANGRFAVQTIRRQKANEVYWPDNSKGATNFWHTLEKVGKNDPPF